MRIYYEATFENKGNRIKGVYFDTINFTAKDGDEYSVDVSGDHDFHEYTKDGIGYISGRIKGDCDMILNMSKNEDEYEDIEYPQLYKLMSNSSDVRIVLCSYDGDIVDTISFDFTLQLNGCTDNLFQRKSL